MSDIEFLDEDAGDGVEELARGPRRPIPRWAYVVAVAVLVVGVLAVVLTRQSGTGPVAPSPVAAPTTPPSRAPEPTPTPTPLPSGVGPDLELGTSSEPVLALAAAGRDTWVLRDDAISMVSPHLSQFSGLAAPVAFQGAQLALDKAADRVWAVFVQDVGATVEVFRASTLAPVGQVGIGQSVQGVAAADGRLYLAIDDRVVVMNQAGAMRTVVRPARGVPVGELVADPSRHRLIAVSRARLDGRPSMLWSIDPRRGTVLTRRTPAMSQVSVARAGDGSIWLAGLDGGDGVLMSLDPHTLRPVLHSSLDPTLAPRAAIVAGGQHVVWVRDSARPVLRCIDSRTGAQVQAWVVDGPVASASGTAVIGYGTQTLILDLQACPG